MWIIKWPGAPFPYCTGHDWSDRQRDAARHKSRKGAKMELAALRRAIPLPKGGPRVLRLKPRKG